MQTATRSEVAPDYAVLRWLVGATFVVILNETIMINAIPRLMVDFDVDANAAQWLSTAFMLTMAVVIPATGWFLQNVMHTDSLTSIWVSAVISAMVAILLRAIIGTFVFDKD